MSNQINQRAILDPVKAAAAIRRSCKQLPDLAIILGSGFQGITRLIEAHQELGYDRVPGFPVPTVAGHAGKLAVGEVAGATVLLLSGRAHYYEGHSMDQVTFPVRVLAELGIKDLLLTNAAGGINRRFRAGDFMMVTDHINFLGANPLRGEPAPERERFVDLTAVYDRGLMKLLRRAARAARVGLRAGVYLAVSGPSYETPAEIHAFERLGADAVGMSTVPEAIVARQCGMRVAALSCITNLAAGRGKGGLSHEEVLDRGAQSAGTATELLREFVRFYAATE